MSFLISIFSTSWTYNRSENFEIDSFSTSAVIKLVLMTIVYGREMFESFCSCCSNARIISSIVARVISFFDWISASDTPWSYGKVRHDLPKTRLHHYIKIDLFVLIWFSVFTMSHEIKITRIFVAFPLKCLRLADVKKDSRRNNIFDPWDNGILHDL